MEKIILGYEWEPAGPCCSDDVVTWSFSLYSSGMVGLQRTHAHEVVSQYRFKVPRSVVYQIIAYFAEHKAIIDVLPEQCICGDDGWIDVIHLYGKK